MKKILIIQDSLRGGGAERVLINILKNIDYNFYSIDLLLLVEEGIYLSELPEQVNILRVYPKLNIENTIIKKSNRAFRRFFNKYFLDKVYYKITKKNYDIEIAFLEGPTTKLLLKSSNKCSKKIAWIHNDLKKYRVMPKSEEIECYQKVDKVICVSEDTKKVFVDLYPQYIDKTDVIYNLINVEEIKKLSNEKINFDFSIPTVVGIGRLVNQKRFDILINAHKQLIEDGINHKLLILGEGGNKQDLLKLIDELKVNESVEIKEFQKNPYPYIKNATVFAMASDFEGFSLVIAEALVLGKAIVSTRCAGPIELLEGGKSGLLVECQNIGQIKGALKQLIIDKNMRVYYENRAIERSKIFDKSKVMESINRLIDGERIYKV